MVPIAYNDLSTSLGGVDAHLFGRFRMTRPDNNDEGRLNKELREIVIEFSGSNQAIPGDESTPTQALDTKDYRESTPVRVVHPIRRLAPVPKQIANRYDLMGELGEGGQATVYLAEDTVLGRKVAIKISKPDRVLNPEERAEFQREAQALAKLDRTGILPVYDFGIHDDGRCFLVLKYLPGKSLKDCLKDPIRNKSFTIERTLQVISQVAEALNYAHQQGIYHRDLKPGNILLDEQGDPHISDFGLAVTWETQHDLKGQVAGTVPYMAPEQVRGEAHWLNGQADIWALGVILYEMLAGNRPFRGRDDDEVKAEILNRHPTALRQWNEDIPLDVERVALQCLEKDTRLRISTARDVCNSLREICTRMKNANSSLVFDAQVASENAEEPANRPIAAILRRTILAGAILSALGLIVFAVMTYVRDQSVDDRLVPDQWNEVLRREPVELVNARPKQAKPDWQYQAHPPKVSFSTNRRTLLSVRDISTPNFDYRVCLKQTPWNGNGNIGVFFGYHVKKNEDFQVAEFQAITVEWNAATSQKPLSIDRSLFLDPLTVNGPPGRRVYLHSVELAPPAFADMPVLLVSVRGNKVVSVQLNDMPFPTLAGPRIDRIAQQHASPECTGQIGLYMSGSVEGSSGEFINAEIIPYGN